jgi:hypothetical protein
VERDKTATETLQLLRDAYGVEALSRARLFGWHRRLVLGRVSVEDDTRSGRPSSSWNEDNVVAGRLIVMQDINQHAHCNSTVFPYHVSDGHLSGRDSPHPSGPALGPIQPTIQAVPGLSRGALTIHAYLAPRLKKEYSYTSNPLLGLRGLF